MLEGIWHGGYSYAHGGEDSIERFQSIAHAKRALVDRYDSNGLRKVKFDFVNRAPERCFVPAVDRSSTIDLHGVARVSFGPRGGVIVHHF